MGNLWIVGTAVGVLAAGMAVAAPDVLGSIVTGGLGLDPEVKGEFRSENDELGTWTFQPDVCRSGEPMGFHGVLLGVDGDDTHRVRVARDPASGSLVVSARKPGTDQAGVFSGCQVDGALQRTNTSVNEVWGVEGKITINCPEDGFSGEATFSNCY